MEGLAFYERVWNKQYISVRSAFPFFPPERFGQHFEEATLFSQKVAWFYTSDGSHWKVHVHFEEFVSHSRFQTLAAELQNGISEIFPGEI